MRSLVRAVVVIAAATAAVAAPALAQQVQFGGALIDAAAVPVLPEVASVVNPQGNEPAPQAYGTTLYNVYNAGPCDAALRSGTGTLALNNCEAAAVSGGYVYIGWPIHIPTGASVQYARIYFNQTVIGDTIGAGFWKADEFGATTVVQVMAPTATTAGNTMQQWGPFAEVIDNEPTNGNVYYFLAYLPGATKIYKMTVYYKLSVSPAPATATFTDVPTSHPQFKFVEALVKAGITGGCGPGAYCPDTAVTRGQMAVFLASALGLAYQY